ncbi:MAG: hypothetical protein ABEJ35_07675 [Halobacteriaceae archaeon]
MSVPPPKAVLEAAAETSGGPTGPAVLNVLVAGQASLEPTLIERADGYHGPGAGVLGRLHAAQSAVDERTSVSLHYPEPQFAAAGRWLVVAPTACTLATVARGRGALTLKTEAVGGGADTRLLAHRERLEAVLDRARPRHEHYPVRDDDRGVFCRGLTTFRLRRVQVAQEGGTIVLGVLTTPTTRAREVEGRFESIDGIREARFRREAPLTRAEPDPEYRTAGERALSTVTGDWEYEWLPRPSVFAQIPSTRKLAIGAGSPDETAFGEDAVRTCRDLITALIGALEGSG